MRTTRTKSRPGASRRVKIGGVGRISKPSPVGAVDVGGNVALRAKLEADANGSPLQIAPRRRAARRPR